ncbi:MAG: hypothetical protein D6819_07065 [Gammaproteobacteria bacterium]|nr:MAG: hypothetical protein D6819_07065 [Gammaproteobacteria bacterium]
MGAWLKIFIDICLFRQGPQVLPPSLALLGLTLGAYFCVGFALAALTLPWSRALLAGAADTLILTFFTYAVLNLKRRLGRFVQTLSALAGSLALIGALSFLPTLGLYRAQMQGQTPTLHVFILLAILIWNIAVIAHVLRYALSMPLGLSALLSLAYVFMSLSLLQVLFG